MTTTSTIPPITLPWTAPQWRRLFLKDLVDNDDFWVLLCRWMDYIGRADGVRHWEASLKAVVPRDEHFLVQLKALDVAFQTGATVLLERGEVPPGVLLDLAAAYRNLAYRICDLTGSPMAKLIFRQLEQEHILPWAANHVVAALSAHYGSTPWGPQHRVAKA